MCISDLEYIILDFRFKNENIELNTLVIRLPKNISEKFLMKKIAVLLTVHNRKQKTLACLKGLYDQEMPDQYSIDTYMTDDGCTDGTPEAVIAEFPQVNIIKGDGNLFWNRGMYKAWDEASKYNYDYYMWLNDDTYLFKDAICKMVDCSLEKPNSIIVGTTTSSENKGMVTYGGQNHDKLLTPNGTLQYCETFNGNMVLIPKYVFNTIGNLDWYYIHAIGDVDYGWMATRAGLKNYIAKEFLGTCETNALPPKWTRPDIAFMERWKNFHSPLAYGEPKAMFHYNSKNFGIFRAIRVLIINYFRVIFPQAYYRIKK